MSATFRRGNGARRKKAFDAHLAAMTGLSAMMIASPALAQSARTPAEAAGASSAQMGTASPGAEEPGTEDIVVTAQKRSENVRDIPKSVEVVTQAQLTQAGVTNLQDLGRISPSIQGSTALPSSPPAIRGIASFALSIGVQTKTGIIVDDVPQPSFSTLANELTDIERIEVLPGPQSTLSGRNAAGGLINIVTHNPTSSFTGQMGFEQTDDRQTRAGGFLSGPITDTLGFSVSGFYDQWDGNIINVANQGHRLGGFEQRGVRAKLLWKAAPGLTATLTGYYTNAAFLTRGLIGGSPYIYAAPGAGSFLTGSTLDQLHPGAAIGPYSQQVSTPGNGVERQRNAGVSLKLDYDVPVGTISSITSYSRSTDPRTDLFVGYPLGGVVARAATDVRVDYVYQELRIASPATSDRLKYLAGVVYSDTDNFEPYVRAPVFPVDWDRSASVRSFAAFGRASYEFLPKLTLTGGLRYQHDDLGYSFIFVDGSATNSRGWSSYGFMSGETSLQYDFAPDIKGYFTYANAQSGQAYDLEDNTSAATPAGLKPVASEKVSNYEAGVKTRLFDRKLTLNLSIFRADYSDYQVQAIQQSNGDISQTPTIRLYSIGRVRSQGVEFSSTLAVSRALRLGLDATYLDGRILDYPGAQCYVGQTAAQGCVNGLQDRRGRLPNTSKFRMTASANYTVPLPSLPVDGTLGAFFRYQTRTFFDLVGDPVDVQKAYGILNLTAGVRDRSGKYHAELFINNVANQHYYAQVTRDGFSSALAVNGLYGRDSFRYFGGRAGVSF